MGQQLFDQAGVSKFMAIKRGNHKDFWMRRQRGSYNLGRSNDWSKVGRISPEDS